MNTFAIRPTPVLSSMITSERGAPMDRADFTEINQNPEFWQDTWEDLQEQLSQDEQWARDVFLRQHPAEW